MNSAKQYMNSAKQCMNSEPMWGYCSRAEKKKKETENMDVENAVCKRSLSWTWTDVWGNVALPKLDLNLTY